MWQRVQTVFLLLVVLFMIATFFFPIWVYIPEGDVEQVLTALYFEQTGAAPQYLPYSLTGVLAVASATLAVIALRKYKNRLLQMKVGAFNSLVMAGTVISAFYFANGIIDTHSGGWRWGIGLWMPMGGVLFNFLANRFIRRDERMVRDADRLR